MPYRPAIYRQAELPLDEPASPDYRSGIQRDDRNTEGLDSLIGFLDELEKRKQSKAQEVNGER